tara:strand:- start:3113 stop:3460 length:348 start_codon:yes stop_codon:yes gene_type:complete
MMDNIEVGIKGKPETFHIAERPPTDDELIRIAKNVVRQATDLMHDDRREWTSIEAMIGFKIGQAQFYHVLNNKQYDQLVGLCMDQIKSMRRKLVKQLEEENLSLEAYKIALIEGV